MMVVDSLVYHPGISRWLKFTATTAGRDKLLRTLQYAARFIAWYNLRTNKTASSIEPFEAIKKHFGQARKLMRLGKFVEHFRAAAYAIDANGMDPVLRVCAIGRQMGYGVYLLLDNITTLHMTGIRKIQSNARLQREAARAWLIGISFNIVAGIYMLSQLRTRQSQLTAKEKGENVAELRSLQRERKTTQTQLLLDVCDFTLPASNLGLANLDEGLVSLAGTTSSILGFSTLWNKTV